MLNIDLDVARRFILGKQGLWPGRRWHGLPGTQAAMRAMEYLQLDPLQVVARSQDLALQGRVLEYEPEMWEQASYEKRQFFDWGGWLATRPMDELPHWRVIMRRERDGHPDCDPRTRKQGREHAAAVEEIRALLGERGTLSNRDFKMADRKRTHGYRGRKDSSLALYYLWRTGEVMTHHRENFERVYALAERVAPGELLHESDEAEADSFLFKKEIGFYGLSRLQRSADAFHRGVPFSRKMEILGELLESGELIEVKVEGWKFMQYALSSDADLIDELIAGRVPEAWKPLETDTTDEAIFLSPLDPVSARGRAKDLFGFDYVWEVYKPADKRQYGYYALPVLWGDRLVARFDSKLDRATNTFTILGFWLEDPALGDDEGFAAALGRGFERFVTFLGAEKLDSRAVREPLLKRRINALI